MSIFCIQRYTSHLRPFELFINVQKLYFCALAIPHICPCHMWGCHTPARHMAAIWLRFIISSEPFMVKLCALRPTTTGFERPHMGRITLSTIFLCAEGGRKYGKVVKCERENNEYRVDEWWWLATILGLYVNPHVIHVFYNINTEVSHLEWYMVCLIVFCPKQDIKKYWIRNCHVTSRSRRITLPH